MATAQLKGLKWIERHLSEIKEYGEPYEVALVAYALLLNKAANAEQAFIILAKHARSIGNYKIKIY